MARYATARETARVLALLSAGGSWTRQEIGQSAKVCLSHVDSAIRAISYMKGKTVLRTRSIPVLFELKEDFRCPGRERSQRSQRRSAWSSTAHPSDSTCPGSSLCSEPITATSWKSQSSLRTGGIRSEAGGCDEGPRNRVAVGIGAGERTRIQT